LDGEFDVWRLILGVMVLGLVWWWCEGGGGGWWWSVEETGLRCRGDCEAADGGDRGDVEVDVLAGEVAEGRLEL
jgi:hypothetical protein